jgi:type I restriction enzyme S subunit
VSELPKGWIETKISDVTEYVQRGKGPKYTDVKSFPVINQKAIRWFGIQEEHLKYVREDMWDKYTEERFIRSGDILWNSTGTGTIGRACLLDEKEAAKAKVVDSHVTIVRSNKSIDPRYLFNWIKSPRIQFDIDSLSTGTTNQVELSKAKVLDTSIPLAPLNEQIRIADKLDSMLAKVDAAQARLDKIPNILKRFRQSVLAAATSGELTKEWRGNNEYKYKRKNIEGKFELDWEIVKERTLPQHWQWVPLGNFAKCARGKFSIRPRNDPSCFDGAYPFIQIGDLPREGGNIISHKQTLNDKGYSVSREFEIGTVVIAIVGATIANTGIVTYPVCFPDSLVGINSPSNIENQYLDYHLRAVKEEIRQASYAGGGQPNIKLTMINPLPLPLPPYEEILEIVRRVESLFTMAATVEKQYKDTKARTNRLTQSILAKAFRGELVPQDENDESASVLLARIAAELTAINTKAKTKPKTKKKIKAV